MRDLSRAFLVLSRVPALVAPMLPLLLVTNLAAGCALADPGSDVQGLELFLAVPADADAIVFTGFAGGGCDEEDQFAVSGSAVAELDHVELGIQTGETFAVPTGSYAFEVIAVEKDEEPPVNVAAGCQRATVRARETTSLDIDLIAIAE